jgi:hypothetical protein
VRVRDNLIERGVDGKIMLVDKQDVAVWSGFIWLMMRDDELPGSVTGKDFCDEAVSVRAQVT